MSAVDSLRRFLNNYRVIKSPKDESSSDIDRAVTHTSINPNGSYHIPQDMRQTLFDILNDMISQKSSIALTERIEDHMVTNIRIDFDFKFPDNEADGAVAPDGRCIRRYNRSHIEGIVETYNKAITAVLDVPADRLQAFIFERDQPYRDNKGMISDGIHIMYPYVVCHTDYQHLIRLEVLKTIGEIIADIDQRRPIEEVIDKAPISACGWMMYGCGKTGKKPYMLTAIYDSEMRSMSAKSFPTNRQLIELLSVRGHDKDGGLKLSQYGHMITEAQQLAKKSTPKATPKATKIKKLPRQPVANDINIDEVRELVRLLDGNRAEDYKTWIDVGLCLHNLDYNLLTDWIDFSRQAPGKFKDGECESVWETMNYDPNGLGIGSLHRWARMDNPVGYQRLMRDNLQLIIIKSISGTTQDVATVIYTMFKYQYVSVGTKNDRWFEFRNHRWVETGRGVSLKKKIGNEVLNEYLKLINYYNSSAIDQHDEHKDQYLDRSKGLTEITYKLRDITFKNKLMAECEIMFYDETFLNKLDSNPDLVGFTNGIYDLSKDEFREGRPEDYISITTGYAYLDFDKDDEIIKAIYTFLNQVFVDPHGKYELRDYVMKILASCLEGRNKQEEFYVLTGVGGNGKSKLMALFDMAMGDYTSKIPISVLTSNVDVAPNASNEAVARLKGRRSISTQEPGEGKRFNINILKDWTGGEKITVRKNYGEQFEFKANFKILFSCNNRPSLPPDDGGVWRRIVVIEFLSRFIDNPDPNNPYEHLRDYNLEEKMALWKEAFMWLLIQYYRGVRAEPPKKPECVSRATENYQKENDAIQEFVDERVVADVTSKLGLSQMYAEFRNWWKQTQTNLKGLPTQAQFKTALEKRLGKYNIRTGWNGYRLMDAQEISELSPDEEPVIKKGSIVTPVQTPNANTNGCRV